MTTIPARPQIDASDALEIVRARFGLDGALTPLPGDRDRNFLLDGPGGRYVVKVSSPDEPEELLRIEGDLIRHLAERTGGLVPTMVEAEAGGYLGVGEDSEGRSHRVRVVEYRAGVQLAQVRPRSPELLHDLGRRTAHLVSALGSYPDHPPARVDFHLALGRAGIVMEQWLDLFEGRRRQIIEDVLHAFRGRESEFLGLGSQVIHGDVNDHNVLVSEPGDGPRRVTGIFDLGDAHSAPRVFDLGITVAYAMFGTQDPLAAAAAVARGFHEVTPLSRDEVDVVYTLARARLGASVAISTWRQRDEGDDPYITISQRPAWDVLERLAEVSDTFGTGVIRDACGFDACPRTASLAEWLPTLTPAPVMKLPEDPSAVTVLDLSVGSPELTGRDTDDTEAFTRRVFDRMADEGATVGIGRYLEPRAFYLSDAFAGRDGDPRERRTVHLGIDIFDEAGAEVFAPISGVIHSVHINADRLDYGPTVMVRHEGPAGPFWTLYGHLEAASVEGLEVGTELKAGDPIARIGPHPENGDWPPHLHFQIVTDLLDYEGTFPGVALPRERSVWASYSPDPGLLVRLPEGATWRAPRDLAERRAAVMGPNLSLSYEEPIHVVRGIGAHLYDVEGRAYLDCVNNVAHVGHEHPAVVEAGRLQMGVLNTNTRYLHEAVVEYAERLVDLLPDPLEVCFFTNSGSEANELALRLARSHTGGSGIVGIEGGYHGNTNGLIDVSHYKFAHEGGAGAPNRVRTVPMPDDYRGEYRRDVPDRAGRYAEHVRSAFEELAGQGHAASSIIAEAILSCGGQIEPPAGYLAAAFEHARTCGAVCIADEVQIGFGRVGTHMWGFETQDAVPDIVTLGKPIGNGHPIGAVVTTRAIAESFDNGMEYFSTFGGNPVSARIGLAVLDVLRDQSLQEHAALVGSALKANLAALAMHHEAIGDVRGRGLFLGVELVRDRTSREPAPEIARYVVNRAKELGVLLSSDGPDANVLKIKPPMVFSQADADRLVSTLDAVLAEDPVRAAASS